MCLLLNPGIDLLARALARFIAAGEIHRFNPRRVLALEQIEEFGLEVVPLLGPQGIGDDELKCPLVAELTARVEGRGKRGEGVVELVRRQIQVQHLGHLLGGRTARAGVSHRQRRFNAVRGKEQVPLLLARELRVQIETKLVRRGGSLSGVILHIISGVSRREHGDAQDDSQRRADAGKFHV